MQISSTSFRDNGVIDGQNAFAVQDPETHVSLSDNRNPALSWSDVPEGTRSFVLICLDPDAPSQPDDVNQEDRSVPADLPRVDFSHWVMVDIPGDVREIAEGSCSEGVTPRGKTDPAGPAGARQGKNDYTAWFAGDADMEGTYLGYDGPCPPWNDSIPHRYRFTVYATDLEHCPVDGAFGAQDVLNAIEGHVLDQAAITGRYSLNPDVEL